MNIRQAARRYLRLLLICVLCKVIETSDYDFMYLMYGLIRITV